MQYKIHNDMAYGSSSSNNLNKKSQQSNVTLNFSRRDRLLRTVYMITAWISNHVYQ